MEVLGFHMLLYSNRIVVTGGTGRFASSLKKVKSKYSVFFPSKSHLNILKENSILKYLKKGGIPIIAGFQGVNNDERITTIGRGGSDATAIMVSKFFKADKCIIYTDVEGV